MNVFIKILKILTVLPAVIEALDKVLTNQKPQNHEKKNKKKFPPQETGNTNS